MATLTDVKRDLVAEAAEDFLGFWLVLSQVQNVLGVEEKPTDRELTLKIVRELLVEDLLLPGSPIDQGPDFDPWNLPVDEAMSRLEKAWDELDDEPFTGDIAWFTATPKGRRRVFESYVAELKDRSVPIEEKKRIYTSLLRMAGDLEDSAWYLTPSVKFKESDIDWERVAKFEAGLAAGTEGETGE